MLHITNGDFVVDLLKNTSLPGEVIAWRDILFEGPIQNLPLEKFSQVRAQYLAQQGYGKLGEIQQSFQQRDERFVQSIDDDEVVLWFEYDVYDQWQLVQILNWYECQHKKPQQLTLICLNSYPEIDKFLGLGQLSSSQLAALFPQRQPITLLQLVLAKEVWIALSNPTPELLTHLLTQDLTYLPYLHNAVRRFLREFPSSSNGLNATQEFILEYISQRPMMLKELFEAFIENEGEFFLGMGDVSFFSCVKKLLMSQKAPIEIARPSHQSIGEVELGLSEFGYKFLSNESDFVVENGINIWLGGVHNTSQDYWCYDDKHLSVEHKRI